MTEIGAYAMSLAEDAVENLNLSSASLDAVLKATPHFEAVCAP